LGLAKDMKETVDYFKRELDLDVYPVYGTLLGMIRDNDFIGWDTDIDLAYLSKYHTNKEVLNEFNMICKFLEDKKLLLYRIKTTSHLHVWSPNKGLKIDLWISWIDENNNYHLVWTVYGDINASMILPFKTIEFKNQTFCQMNNPERFLNEHYPNWEVPIDGTANEWAKRKPIFELEPWHGK
jgi:phosphorylcholine metabolism protein LicD